MNLQRRRLLVMGGSAVCVSALGLSVVGCRRGRSPGAPMDEAPGFWIWHRGSSLSDDELAALAAGGGGRLYRQIAEFGPRAGGWSPRPLPGAWPSREGGTPVLRLDPGGEILDRADAPRAVAAWLRHHYPNVAWPALQLDYDCPARLLGRYAGFLADLRGILEIGALSVTALAGWIRSPGFGQVAAAVDELVPMFYDLRADPEADVLAGRPLPMAGREAVRWIGEWKSCRRSWRAGLANFERLTLFNGDGTLAGHLRAWSPEDLVGRGDLELLDSRTEDTAVWRVLRDGALRGTRLRAGQWLVWRVPAAAASLAAMRAARDAGAAGIVWFALPGPGLRAAHSPSHLAGLAAGSVPPFRLALSVREGALVVRNDGPGDLMQRPGDGLSQVRVEAPEPGLFVPGGPGGCFEIRGGDGLPIALARRVLLAFPGLPAGAEVATDPGTTHLPEDRPPVWSLIDPSQPPVP